MLNARTAARWVVVSLLLASACAKSSGGPTASQVPAGASALRVTSVAETKEGGTGTRAKAESAPAPEPVSAPAAESAPASSEAGTSAYNFQDSAPVAAEPAKRAAAPAAVAPAPRGIVSGKGQPSAGHGRLSGAHATRSPASAGGQAPGGRVDRKGKGFGFPPMALGDGAMGQGLSAVGNVEAPNTENYAHNPANEFLRVTDHPLSTFSADVDTASYSNARRFLASSQLPPKDAIRVEEWVNYFAYDYRAPSDSQPFAVNAEVSSCPWEPSHKLVRIGLKGRPIAEEKVPPRNLVFLIDVSGSMTPPDKLPLLKSGLSMLARQLRPEDSIAMVVYAGSSGLVLPATSGNANQRAALEALGRLEAGGSTNGGDGIRLAYSVAQQHFKKGGINRVILATDGDFNVGTTSEGELTRLIEDKRKSGVFLTVLGFGQGNLKDSAMEALADKGNGNYAYIDSPYEARKVLVREAGATLVAIAKDVKLQVEWNPKRVASYRLVGYENRVLAAQDFNDDKKDAGEIGAGHTVTALYEIVPPGAATVGAPKVDPLKYQQPGAPSVAAAGSELGTVKIRYKQPSSEISTLLQQVVLDADRPFDGASVDHRFAVAVAEAALLLRGAPGMARVSLTQARGLAANALGSDLHGDRREFLGMLDRAASLSQGE